VPEPSYGRCRRAALLILAFLLASPTAAWAVDLYSEEDVFWKVSGYLKNFSTMTRFGDLYRDLGIIDRETFWDTAGRARLRSVLHAGPDVDFVAHYEAFVRVGDTQRAKRSAEDLFADTPGGDALLEQLFPESRPPRLFGLEQTEETDDAIIVHGLDRLYLRLLGDDFDLAVGRLALTWGPGMFWNPTDYFAPFSPTQIDKEEKLGVDMFRAAVNIGDNASIEGVLAPVRRKDVDDIDIDRSASALRAVANALSFDLAASGDFIYDRSAVGLDLAGHRQRYLDDPDPYIQAIVDADYGFPWAWNPYLMVEYHFNGRGENDPDDYLELAARQSFQEGIRRGEAANLGRHYAGIQARIQPHPLVTISEALIVNITDQSVFSGLHLSWSVLESLELQLGADLTFGPAPSEFGGFTDPRTGKDYGVADLYFAYLKWYW